MDELGNIHLVRSGIDPGKFIKTTQEVIPGYENSHHIAAILQHFNWESDRIFEYLEEMNRKL